MVKYIIYSLILVVIPARGYSFDEDKVNKAIKSGVEFLKFCYSSNDNLEAQGSYIFGKAALAGIALLESHLDKEDAVIRRISKYIRANALDQSGTYEISLALLYLDLLHEENDEPLIQMLGIRLLSGQVADGSWSYECELTGEETILLRKIAPTILNPSLHGSNKKILPGDMEPEKKPIKKVANPTIGRDDIPELLPKSAPKEKKSTTGTTGTKSGNKTATNGNGKANLPKPPPLHPEVGKFLKIVNQRRGNRLNVGMMGFGGDHSNTQFATVGLWVGRRHGVPVETAIAQLEMHYLGVQIADGGWTYSSTINLGTSATMTCAGLMGLGVGMGMRQEAKLYSKPIPKVKIKRPQNIKAPQFNKPIEMALKLLGAYLKNGTDDSLHNAGRPLVDNYYFLWGLERVAVAFDLKKIGGIDWFDWGAEALIQQQNRNGSWGGMRQPTVDTSFALLFLNRANLMTDLTISLKGKVQDTEVFLKNRLPDGLPKDLVGKDKNNQHTDPRKKNALAPYDPIGQNPKGNAKKEIATNLPVKPDGSGSSQQVASNSPAPTTNNNIPNPNPGKDSVNPSGQVPVKPDKNVKTNLPVPEIPPTIYSPTKLHDIPEVDALMKRLVQAKGEEWNQILVQYRDSKGSQYTETLVAVSSRYAGESLEKIRESLITRLCRMTPTTLQQLITQPRVELKRCAAIACGRKKNPNLIPILTPLLTDNDVTVVHAAHESLKLLARTDLGPKNESSDSEKRKSLQDWTNWWQKNHKKY